LKISVSCKSSPGLGSNMVELHFRIRDTGIGIPADKVELIFAPFMQADDSTTRRFGGTGLGLSITRSIVERMNGRVWVESKVGVGSAFHFTALLAAPELASQAGSLRAAGQRAGSRPKPIVALPMPPAGPRPHVVIWQGKTDNDPDLVDSLHQWQMKSEVVSEPSQVAAALARQPANTGPRTVLVKATALRGISERSIEKALAGTPHRISAILLEDTALPDSLLATFPRSLTWPGSPSALFDALACIDGFANSALYDFSPTEVMDPDELPTARHILLAEDHPINQKLARRLLEQMGHEVVVADDGVKAVQLSDQQSFDIIFMDVQMPVMNGFDATHEIRSRDRARGHYTPIVAMTAHAMAGDRERCLAVGMDGYVSKPITRAALEQAIKEHALRSPSTQPPTASVKPVVPAVDRISLSFDGASALPIFDRQSALARLGGDESLLDELIEIFLARGESDARHLREAMTAHDLGKLCHVAHALRGAASSLGADELSSCATEVEQACRQDDSARALTGGKVLLIALQKVLQVMRPTREHA
jgi:CheY-like chemotaxis protein/HPt (histidine-containing phosphotransfer) domain-containing protein